MKDGIFLIDIRVNNNYIEDKIYLENKAILDKYTNKKVKWLINSDFPQEAVIKAYISPNVNLSLINPTWGNIQLDKLYIYCKNEFNWDNIKTDEKIKPIIDKEFEFSLQKQYFIIYY